MRWRLLTHGLHATLIAGAALAAEPVVTPVPTATATPAVAPTGGTTHEPQVPAASASPTPTQTPPTAETTTGQTVATTGTQLGPEVVSLDAAQQEWIQGTLWCGLGNVVIRYQDVTMRADEVELDLTTLVAHARGNVIIDQGTTRLSCSNAVFDLKKKVGTLEDAEGFFPPTYYFRGKQIEKLDETHYRFREGVFTSCNLDANTPPWSISVREAVVELEGYGHFRGAAIKVKGVPIFYTPRLLWPVKRDRAAGLLTPMVGYSGTRGAYLGNALFLPLSRSFDTTLLLDLYSKGFVGIGDELRWAPAAAAKGFLRPEMVWDPDTRTWEWKVQGKHNQLLPGGYAIRAELIQFSNIDFFQQFEHTFDQNAPRSVYSYVTLSRTWGPQAVNLMVDHRQTFFGTTYTGSSANNVTLDRQPTLEYRLRSTRVGHSPVYVSLIASADRFRVGRSSTLKGNYSRLDVFPSLSLLTPGLSWLNVTPTLGARGTWYTARYNQSQTAFEDRAISRTYSSAGLSIVGPSFSRIWVGKTSKFKHLIEPRIDYSYVSNPGAATQIPLFDEKDSVLVTNQTTFTLANSLFFKGADGSSREVARLELSQAYSFSDPITFARPAADLPASRRGPLSLWLHASPLPNATIDARSYLDPLTHHLTSASLTGGIFQGGNALNLTWYASYDGATGRALSSQTRIFAGFSPGNGALRIETNIAYDIHMAKLLDQTYVIRYRGSCWSVYAQVRDYKNQTYPIRDYRIAIDLTGLGTFLDIRGSLDTLGRTQ
ncbi:MAG: LPS-assembly protein LptD [Acidobacteriota bacterium]